MKSVNTPKLSPGRPLKVLWAVDAFDGPQSPQAKAARVLAAMARKIPLAVDPVYVISLAQLGITERVTEASAEAYTPAALEALKESSREGAASLPLGEARVLVQPGASLHGAVDTLTRHAESQGYDLIVVGSHGRRGLRRLMLGSFAEALLQHSRVPVLIAGNHADRGTASIERVLVPDDFADPEAPFFAEAFEAAHALGAKTTLFTAVPRPAEQVLQSGVYLLSGAWLPAPLYLEQGAERRSGAADRLKTRAAEAGMAVEVAIDDTSASVVEAILRKAEETRADLILMAAHSGPVASTLLGSVTRQVARLAPCPVWVHRQPAPEAPGRA